MKKFTDRVLSCTADAALEAFLEACGLASRLGSYEPEMSAEANEFKNTRMSHVEKMYNKIMHK